MKTKRRHEFHEFHELARIQTSRNQFVKISVIRVSPSVCIGVHPWFIRRRASRSDGLDQIFFQRVRRQMRVQRDQPAFVFPRDFDEPGVVDLLMSQGAPINRRRIRGGRIPKMVRLVPRPLLQQRDGVLRRNRIARISRVGRKPDKSQLRERASRPAAFGVRGKPSVRLGVMLMIRPRQCQQHICVK